MNAAYLYPQLLQMKEINQKRLAIWKQYNEVFTKYESIKTPVISPDCCHNAHMYYVRFGDLETRTDFIQHMKSEEIMCVFHYVSLHSSPFGQKVGRVSGDMKVTDLVSDTLVRLPLYYSMESGTQNRIIDAAERFLRKTK
jgi:dTDP-4-amino-4,6-dideoxygalactose transaminase